MQNTGVNIPLMPKQTLLPLLSISLLCLGLRTPCVCYLATFKHLLSLGHHLIYVYAVFVYVQSSPEKQKGNKVLILPLLSQGGKGI